jgi:hypothetical protein
MFWSKLSLKRGAGGSKKGVTKVLQQCYKGITTVLLGFYKSVTRVLQQCNKGITTLSLGFYKGVTRVLQQCYKGITTVLPGCYKSVTRVLQKCYTSCFLFFVPVGWCSGPDYPWTEGPGAAPTTDRKTAFFRSPMLQGCSSDVTVMLQWRYSGVTIALQGGRRQLKRKV